MSIQFRLPEAAREQYGLPEVVTYDPDVMMLDDAIEVDDLLGVDPFTLTERLAPKDGSRRDMRAWKFVIWKAAQRAGADVTFDDFNLDLFALRIVPEAEGGPKATATDVPSIPASSSDESSAVSAT